MIKSIKIKLNYKNIISEIIGTLFVAAVCLCVEQLKFGIALKLCTSMLGSVIVYFTVLLLMKNEVVFQFLKECKKVWKRRED